MIIYWGGQGFLFGEDDILRFDPMGVGGPQVYNEGFSLDDSTLVSFSGGKDVNEGVLFDVSPSLFPDSAAVLLADFGIADSSGWSVQEFLDFVESIQELVSAGISFDAYVAKQIVSVPGIGFTLEFAKFEYTMNFRNEDYSQGFSGNYW